MMVICRKTIFGGQDLTIKMAVWKLKISPIKKKINDEIEKEEMMNIIYFVW